MPLIVDPELAAEVVRQFNLKGALAPFNLTEDVVPIFDIGTLVRAVDPTVVTTTDGSQGLRVGTLTGQAIQVRTPPLLDTLVVDGGFSINPGAGVLLADGGPQSVTEKYYKITISCNVAHDFVIEWRNAADAANLATWSVLVGGPSSSVFTFETFVQPTAANERIRVVNGRALVGTAAATVSVSAGAASVAV